MGNTQTNLSIDKYFEREPERSDKKISITVKVSPAALGSDGAQHNFITLTVSENGDCLSVLEGANGEFCWTPKSHMRDFEVVDQFTANEVKVARGQGIGVVIVEPKEMYIKLIYDKTYTHGVRAVSVFKWGQDKNSRSVLAADLALGYNVVILRDNEELDDLCEEKDERDEEETLILFDHLKPLAHYNHDKPEAEEYSSPKRAKPSDL
jgi:hypothetical protein